MSGVALPAKGSEGGARPLTVLVVDDSATARKSIEIELRELGAQVLDARDGPSAITAARSNQPDLITLDIQMPNMSGYDVCEDLKMYEQTIGIPIIMISGRSSDKERLESLSAGAVEYFVKPFAPGTLRTFIEDLFVRLRANRDKVIYAIDENRAQRGMYERIFANHGYRCRVFTDGDTLVAAMREVPCDLVMIDLNLPERKGYELLDAIRRQPRFALIPIIATTSSGTRKDLPIAFHSGANDFLRKPLLVEELLARVDNQLHLKTLKERLHIEATIDPLTRLYNRREIERIARIEVLRALRDHQHLGVLIFDADHFKAINDTYGHGFGDEVLQRVAEHLSRGVRVTDVVGRIGGEEFIVIAPQADPDGLRVIAERVRSAIAASPIAGPGGPVPITISVGGSSWSKEKLNVALGFEQLMQRPDEALYKSKRDGRNRTTILPP